MLNSKPAANENSSSQYKLIISLLTQLFVSIKFWLKPAVSPRKDSIFSTKPLMISWYNLENNRLAVHPFSSNLGVNVYGERPSTSGANGHELLEWTATNFWGERPRTFGVNGHELMGWTATGSRVNEDFWGERPRTSGVNGHELLGWTATSSRVNENFWGERPPILG